MNDVDVFREALLEIAGAITQDEVVDISTPNGTVYRIHTNDEYHIEVHETMFNWRVVSVPLDDLSYVESAYCYVGKDVIVFLRAVIGAKGWDGHGDPEGWDKNAGTSTWNPASDRKPSHVDG